MPGKIESAVAELYGAMGISVDMSKGMDGEAQATSDYSMSGKDGDEDGDGDDDDDEDDEMEKSASDDDGDGDDDDDEDADDDEGEGDDGMEKSVSDDDDEEDDLDKSLTDEDDDLQKSIDATPVFSHFAAQMQALADGVDEAFGGLQAVLVKSMSEQETVQEALVKGMSGTLQMVKSLTETVSALQETVNKLAGQPRPRKAASAGNNGVMEKSVAGQAPANPQGQNPAFERSHGMHPSQLQQNLVKGIRWGMVDEAMSNVFDRTKTVPEDVFAVIKDLHKFKNPPQQVG